MTTVYFSTETVFSPVLGFGIGPIGLPETIVLGLLALLIFGKRLPEVGKSLGKGIVEFKKGLSGVEDDIKQAQTAGDPKQLNTDTPAPPPAAATEYQEEARPSPPQA